MFRPLPQVLLTLGLALLCQCATPPRRPIETVSATPIIARWTHVAGTLAAAIPVDVQGKRIPWKFSVRTAETINARSWPSGRVEITSGTLTFAKNEGELAAVTAHEMAHVFCRHGRQRALDSWATLLGGMALGAVTAAHDGATATALGVASGAILTVSLTALTARQREQEYEADRVSLILMSRAGYPVQGAVDFWERYAAHRARHGLGRGGWWKAHPPDAERVRRLRELAAAP